LVIGFIDHLQIVTEVSLINTLQLTTARTKSSQFIFTSRFLVTNPDNVTLRLAVYRQSAHLGAKPLETHDQRFFSTEPLRP
jgi:hypothetical protein